MDYVNEINKQLLSLDRNLRKALFWTWMLFAGALILGLVFLNYGVFDPALPDNTYKSGLLALGGTFLGTTLVTVYLELLSQNRKLQHIQDVLAIITEYKKNSNLEYRKEIIELFEKISGYVWEK